MEGGEYSPPPLPLLPPPPPNIEGSQRRKKDKNNKRFSDEQIRSLESIFKLETKLEPRKKLQLARELGLQPRQVAIWFQNRRARWKSKQIEQEYRVLKANYDNLNSRYESLKKEKQSLLIQSQKLSDLLKKSPDEGRGSKDLEGNSTESEGLDHGVVMYSDDDYEKGNTGYLPHKEETELLNLGEQVVDGSLVPQEKLCGFECGGGVFDHTCGTSNWWEFWTQ